MSAETDPQHVASGLEREWDAGRVVDLLSHARRVQRVLDGGRTHDGAGQVIEWLVEMLEGVQGEVYLWRQGELSDEQAIEAVRDAIGF